MKITLRLYSPLLTNCLSRQTLQLISPPPHGIILFLEFFSSKIIDIHNHLNLSASAYNCTPWITTLDPPSSTPSTFQSPSVEEITRLITKSKNSSCLLDPIPTALVKTCLPSIVPIITFIINSVPISLKTASVTPTLKKPCLDPNDPNNYRPISNLPIHYNISTSSPPS